MTEQERTDLALTLFVPGVAANDVHATFAANDFAIFANSLDARSNFHEDSSPVRSTQCAKASQYKRLRRRAARAVPPDATYFGGPRGEPSALASGFCDQSLPREARG